MNGVVARVGDTPANEFLPTRVDTRLRSGCFDLNSGNPFVSLKAGGMVLYFDTDSISIGRPEFKSDWSPESVKKMLVLLAESKDLRQVALDLRDAMIFLPLQYIGETGVLVPDSLSEGISSSLFPYVEISKASREQLCNEELKVEKIVDRVTEIRSILRTAGEQLEECQRGCAERHPDEGNIFQKLAAAAARLGCGAGCLVKAFVDVVVGFVEIVTEVVREVVTRIVVCVDPPPNQIAVPYEGRFKDVGIITSSGVDNIPDNAKPKPDDFKKLAELFKSFGDLSETAECILNANWSIRDLRDLGYQGFADIFPISFSICFDENCVKKLLKAGPKAIIAAVAELGSLATAAPIAASAVTFSLALALKVLAIASVLIGYQILAILGQILILQALGKTSNGVCLNHPTLVVGLAATIFGPLGILSGGAAALNTPFIVTPR